jgi:hypothetical protein
MRLNENLDDILFTFLIMFFALILGIGIGAKTSRGVMQSYAIEKGVGRYNPTNANFEWIVANTNVVLNKN